MFFIPYGTAESTGRKSFPYVNVALVLANIAAFIIELSVLNSGGPASFETFINQYSFVPSSLSHSLLQPALLTALFLHAGFLHIIGNMMYLLPFGDNVEDRLGHLRYLLFYLICGVAASLIYAAFNFNSLVPLLGASGAIAGVLGGYVALHPTRSSVKGFLWVIIVLIPIRLPALLFIGYWFIMQLFSSITVLGTETAASSGGIAFLAHVGGFLTGLVLAPLMAKHTTITSEAS